MFDKFFIKMSDKEYFSRPEISNSDLIKYNDEGIENFLHYKQVGSDTMNENFEFGRIVHCLILEPDKFEDLYYVTGSMTLPNSTNSRDFCNFLIEDSSTSLIEAYSQSYSTTNKKLDQIKEESTKLYDKYRKYIDMRIRHKDKILLTDEVYEKAIACLNSVQDTEYWKILTDRIQSNNLISYFENVMLFNYKELSMRVKADLVLIEVLEDQFNFEIVDIKTSRNASPQHFKQSFYNYKYDWQAFVYRQPIIKMCEELNIHNYSLSSIYIVVQKEEPVFSKVYEISTETINAAKEKVDSCIESFKRDLKKERGIINAIL